MKKCSAVVLIAAGICFGVHAGPPIFQQLAGKIDIVVAADNSGDYTKIQAAIDAVPDGNPARKVIFVKPGTYQEKIVVPFRKTNIVLVGEHADSCIILYNDASKETVAMNTFTSYAMRVDADDFRAMNITIENRATSAQAVALHTNGDRQVFLHCRVKGWQDTYFNNIRTRAYFRDCFIQGAIDYIFGYGVVLFDTCQINTLRAKGYMTASATSQHYKFGHVFLNCKLTAPSNITQVYLGRPWFAYARTVFFTCWEGPLVNPEGWCKWAGREDTCYYREYKCSGPGSDFGKRVYFGKQLTDQEAKSYRMDSIFSKSVFPQGETADTAEINTILRRFQVSSTPNMVQIAKEFLKCGRDTFPPRPATDWLPDVNADDIYAVIKKNFVHFIDSGKPVEALKAPKAAAGKNLVAVLQNPVRDRIVFRVTTGHEGTIVLNVFDARGRLVARAAVVSVPGKPAFAACDARTLKQGAYFYSIEAGGTVARGRVIVGSW